MIKANKIFNNSKSLAENIKHSVGLLGIEESCWRQ